MYGWGLRSLEETCGLAYLGALETAIPFMAARDKICPHMAPVWGGEDCWGEGASSDSRWRIVLESGCQEGDELRRVWSRLVIQGREAADWLGEELKEVFNTRVEGLGGPSVIGQTRGIIVKSTEKNKSSCTDQRMTDTPGPEDRGTS